MNPDHSAPTTPTLTDSGPLPGTPGINISAPSVVADTDSRTPLAVTARAVGSECRMRQTDSRSGTNTSAPHGGGQPGRSSPIVRSASWLADRSGVVSSATVAPSAFSSSTAAASASSIEPSTGYSRSKPWASERSPSSAIDTTRGLVRRASVTTALARGSRTGLTSALPALPAPGMVDSLCQPGDMLSASSAARTASQA
ncbi:hypothetical protein [Mycolicibacterium vanbaalenii]|uniref:hypothetical protein n=1 Tax=Mycolicibacterium vanbaalenii TaxID=110539 RepID=UPI0021F36C1C|nr:hypothetical protein [Mycolicibacterium vanbaalenii]